MALLKFKEKHIAQSTTAVTATNGIGAPADDTQADITFSLTGTKTVLVVYQANNVHGSTMTASGMKNAISVDGVDVAVSTDAGYNAANVATRNCVFWVGQLAAGSHSIKGRFSGATSGNTAVTVSNRILAVYVFDGDEFYYVDDGNTVTTTSATLVDDTRASITFTPSNNCKALYLFNTSCAHLATSAAGRKAAINVAGTDYGAAEKQRPSTDRADSIFCTYAQSLTPVSTTVKGRFASSVAASTVTTSRRQLAVLLFADDTLLDTAITATQASTTSNAFVDDPQVTISRTTTDTRELFLIASESKKNPTSSNSRGEAYGVMLDGTDKQNSRGSTTSNTTGNSAATAYGETLTAGSHTIKGRFSNNYSTDTAKIDDRTVIALWFSSVATTAVNIVTDTARKLTNTKTVPADTKRAKRITLTVALDTVRRVSRVVTLAADTLRSIVTLIHVVAALDTLRRVRKTTSLASDTIRRVVRTVSPLGDTKRRATASTTSTNDTARVVIKTATAAADTKRIKRATAALSYSTKRKVIHSLAVTADTLRRVVRTITYQVDTRRLINKCFTKVFDTLRHVLRNALQAKQNSVYSLVPLEARYKAVEVAYKYIVEGIAGMANYYRVGEAKEVGYKVTATDRTAFELSSTYTVLKEDGTQQAQGDAGVDGATVFMLFSPTEKGVYKIIFTISVTPLTDEGLPDTAKNVETLVEAKEITVI